MNSRERVKATINHREGDRIPLDNNGFVSGMHEIAYKNLINFINFKDEIKIYDHVQRLAIVNDKIKNLLGVDTRYLYAKSGFNFAMKINGDGTFVDEFGAVFKNVGYYADNVKPPLKGMSFDEIKNYKLPDPKDISRFDNLDNESKSLYENTDFSLWGGSCQTVFYLAWVLRGMEDFMADTSLDKKLSLYLIDMISEWVMQWYEGFMSKVGKYIDVFWFADDWGTQNGPLISPDYFRKEIVPRLKKIISFIKTKTDAKCCYHTCGSTYWCLDDLIDAGVDIVHPLQVTAAGNDTKKIKLEYGKRLCFHGGTNNQGLFHKDIHLLSIDTLERIKDLAQGGGYVFSSGHNIQANMPPENILRIFEIAREFGKYPLDVDGINKEIAKEKKELDEKKTYFMYL